MSESPVEEFNFGESIPVMSEFAESDIQEIRYVLHKYDGDFNANEIEAGLAGEPIETLVFVNGELVSTSLTARKEEIKCQ